MTSKTPIVISDKIDKQPPYDTIGLGYTCETGTRQAHDKTAADGYTTIHYFTGGAMIPKTKTCKQCNQALPYSAFYANPSNKTDGLQAACKQCHKQRMSAHRQTLHFRKWQREFRQQPHIQKRRKARNAVNNAVKRGEIPPVHTRTCVLCGEPATQHHHHRGYDAPYRLDVIPICNRHSDMDNGQPKRLPEGQLALFEATP